MPVKNSIKKYVANGIYHVYNRANNHCELFNLKEDHEAFLGILCDRLLKEMNPLNRGKKFRDNIDILAFCLMPTHFHLLLRQKDSRDMPSFMKSLQLGYAYYQKYKYDLRGRLFESRYKARLIEADADLLNISKYIHQNPSELDMDIFQYPFSSLGIYLEGQSNSSEGFGFLNTDILMKYFNYSPALYKKYIES